MTEESTVYVVDDDPAVREGIEFLISTVGLHFSGFSSAQEFIESYNPSRPGCLILDVRMPLMGGLELQDKLNKFDYVLPIIFLTGHGDVSSTAKALKSGAYDFLEKPPEDQLFLDTIQKALRYDVERRLKIQEKQKMQDMLSLLSDKELEVLKMVLEGIPNKTIAYELNLNEKTIEYHRAKIMRKLKKQTIQELTRFAMRAGII